MGRVGAGGGGEKEGGVRRGVGMGSSCSQVVYLAHEKAVVESMLIIAYLID